MLELAQARRIDAVLVTEVSRWGRSTQDLLDTLYKLAGWKVSVVAMSGMTFELDTSHGRMLAGIAQFESDLLSERVKSGLAAARAAGQEARPSTWPAPQVRPAGSKGAPCCRRREELPLDRRDLGISKNTVADIVKRHRVNPYPGPPGDTAAHYAEVELKTPVFGSITAEC